MTLSQYATNPSSFDATHTTLLLLPGNHSLNSTLRVTDILHMEIFTNTTFHTRVLCENLVESRMDNGQNVSTSVDYTLLVAH